MSCMATVGVILAAALIGLFLLEAWHRPRR